MAELHGTDPTAAEVESYESPEEYSGQGGDRVIRALRFAYTVQMEDESGNVVVQGREALQGETVTLEQIGLMAQKKGEESHAFYTSDERERVEAGESPDASVGETSGNVSSMG